MTFAGGLTSAFVDGTLLGTSTNTPVYNLQDNWTLTLGNFDAIWMR
jgi:hypothetical protein